MLPNGTTKIDDIIKEIMNNANQDGQSKARVREVWKEIAGKDVIQNCEIMSIRDGIIAVRCTTATARNLLMLKKNQILRKFAKNYSSLLITDIKIVK